MGKFNVSQNSFSMGELSPTIKGRSDLKEYKQGLEELKNMTILPAGGAAKRPGLIYKFDQPCANADGSNTGIIPFNPDDSTGYYIILCTDGNTPSSSNVDIYKIDGTVCTVTFPVTLTQTLPSGLDPLGWRYTQSADVLFLTHSSGLAEPLVIYRTADTTFQYRPYDANGLLGYLAHAALPFQDTNTALIAMTYTASNTLTSSAPYFAATDVGSVIKVNNGANDVMLSILSFTSTTQVGVFEISPGLIGAVGATSNWAISAWGGRTGYPTQVTIFNQRLCWMATKGGAANLNSEPNKIWCSAAGNLLRMTRDTATATTFDSSDAFNFAIGGSKPNLIVWCEAGRSLKIGTIGEENIVDFAVLDDNSSSYAIVKQQTSHGGSDVMSVNSGLSTLFVSRTKKEIRQFKYNDTNGSFISTNMNILASHFFDGAIRRLVWQESEKILWVLSDEFDTIHSITIDTDAQVVAWAEHKLGDDFDNSSRSLLIEDMTIISNGIRDELVLLVTNSILLGTKEYTVMQIAPKFDSDRYDFMPLGALGFGTRPYFVDHAIRSYDAVAKTVHTLTTALNGSLVSVLADGLPVGDFLVTAGDITLTTAANEVIAGLKYKARIKTLPIEAGGTIGDSVATVKRIDEINIRFHRSMSAKFGDHYTDGYGNLEQMEFDTDGTLFSGIKTVKMPNGYETDGDSHVVIEQESPTPMTVLSLTYKGQSGN